jgi:hypothetical protein
MKTQTLDGLYVSEFIEHGTELAHKLTQPTEDVILERNKRLRNNRGAVNDLGKGNDGGTWGRWVASIPEIDFNMAIKAGYDLNSRDPKRKAAEMNRFLATPIGRACLIQENGKKYFMGN